MSFKVSTQKYLGLADYKYIPRQSNIEHMKINQIMKSEAQIFESIADISCRTRKESFVFLFIEKELTALKSMVSRFLTESYLMDARSDNLKELKTFESELTSADLCEFLNLTNRTPNGALMSRVEVDDIFSLAQREVIEIIDKIGLMEYISNSIFRLVFA